MATTFATSQVSEETSLAVKYSPKMVGAILSAPVKQVEADVVEVHSFAAGPHKDEPELTEKYPEHEEKYVDDLSGKPLRTEDVRKARQEEMQWIEKRQCSPKYP